MAVRGACVVVQQKGGAPGTSWWWRDGALGAWRVAVAGGRERKGSCSWPGSEAGGCPCAPAVATAHASAAHGCMATNRMHPGTCSMLTKQDELGPLQSEVSVGVCHGRPVWGQAGAVDLCLCVVCDAQMPGDEASDY